MQNNLLKFKIELLVDMGGLSSAQRDALGAVNVGCLFLLLHLVYIGYTELSRMSYSVSRSRQLEFIVVVLPFVLSFIVHVLFGYLLE